MERIISAQGGDPNVVRNPALLPRAPEVLDLPAPKSGYVASIDAREVGLAAIALGAGRTRADQEVDPAVGIEMLAKPGDGVKKGAPLARLHVRSAAPEVAERVLAAFRIAAKPPRATPLVLDRIT
jgi:pyrimidine-nucleoside phosphorylase